VYIFKFVKQDPNSPCRSRSIGEKKEECADHFILIIRRKAEYILSETNMFYIVRKSRPQHNWIFPHTIAGVSDTDTIYSRYYRWQNVRRNETYI